MLRTPFLQALYEAANDDGKINTADEAAEDTKELDPEADAEPKPPEGEDTPPETEEPGEDNGGLDNEEGPIDDVKGPLDGDDMSSDGEGEDNMDLSNNPDGLPSPDDEGEADHSSDDEEEQNVQINILNLSKLDRLSLKRKCLTDFRDLQSKSERIRKLIDDNEHLLEPDVREKAMSDVSALSSDIGLYLDTKFSYNNYEENFKNYNILCAQLSDIIKYVLNEKDEKKFSKKDKNNDK